MTGVREVDPGKAAVGFWIVRGDEQFLKGHFPGKPIVPGVLITEPRSRSSPVLLPRATQTIRQACWRVRTCDSSHPSSRRRRSNCRRPSRDTRPAPAVRRDRQRGRPAGGARHGHAPLRSNAMTMRRFACIVALSFTLASRAIAQTNPTTQPTDPGLAAQLQAIDAKAEQIRI